MAEPYVALCRGCSVAAEDFDWLPDVLANASRVAISLRAAHMICARYGRGRVRLSLCHGFWGDRPEGFRWRLTPTNYALASRVARVVEEQDAVFGGVLHPRHVGVARIGAVLERAPDRFGWTLPVVVARAIMCGESQQRTI